MGINDVLPKLKGVKSTASGWTALCPAHDDRRNSLSVSRGAGESVLLHCHAGCTFEAVQAALVADAPGRARVVSTYDYRDEAGALLYQAVRLEPKDFRQRKPDGAGGWAYKLNGVPRVPYRLPELLAAPTEETVFIVEGEKDADRLSALGLVATTNAGGAGKWRDEFSDYLRGRRVVVIPDNDEPGRDHAARVAQSLCGVGAEVRLLSLPGLPPKGDVSDWLDSGGLVDELLVLADSAPAFSGGEGATAPKVKSLTLVCMADVEPETVRWLWHPYIPFGKLTVLEGQAGLGKSWLTCALASAVSRGGALPGCEPFEPGNVVMLSAEDGLADTVRPRLGAMGADVSRVFAVKELFALDSLGMLLLEEKVAEARPALVIIDPLFAYTGGKVDINRANECRAVTAPLAALAERYGCALVAVRHLSKSKGGGDALNAGIGSVDITAAARSVLLVGKDPDDEKRRAVVQTKNNLAPQGGALGYKVEDGQFYWTGESTLTAGRILSLPSDEQGRGEQAEAADFLRQVLAEGPRAAKEIKAEAHQVGLSEQMLRTARMRLGVRTRKEGGSFGKVGQRWVWYLPGAEDAAEGVAEDVAEGAEDVGESGEQHLQPNGADKGTYGNGLAEDVATPLLQHLQGGNQHLQAAREEPATAPEGAAERAGLREIFEF
ncbi:MAG: AAA family ATPase [Acidobacteriota bacterium]|nr:AAA family ATPase [Acidobacteriota bacterium]